MIKQKRSVGLLSVLFVLILVISACSETTEISSGVSEAMEVAGKYKTAELESLSNLEFTERNANETQIELNYTGTASLGEETLDLEGTIYLLKEADKWKVNNNVSRKKRLVF
ncbi:hypothetical protein [Paenibacillus gallinarum]|uniref:Uncharacterized protein n=1 Tax=Paenibacillus gallinarum TaxID=2762232 RepID=A0ABR8T5G5_9BACL|nr:hypothetical protein [Paenibacillus gallinarum]MBD7971004.1 hypothetical protein [Paenibacillus gallinarum]